MTRITFLGDEIVSPKRDKKGCYARKGRLAFLTLMLAVVSILVFNVHFDKWYDTEISYVAPVYAGVTMESKVEGMKSDILNRLQACESAGYSEEDGIVIMDSNDKHSFGQLQFQKTTVQHYMQKLYSQKITGKEAVLIALDTAKARALASDIIWLEEGGVYNWANCAKKTGIIPEIATIKKLEQ